MCTAPAWVQACIVVISGGSPVRDRGIAVPSRGFPFSQIDVGRDFTDAGLGKTSRLGESPTWDGGMLSQDG